MNRIDQAYELADRQEAGAAVALLEEGGRVGDADCWVELAAWHLSGSIIPRDLAKCRQYFRLAGDAGHERARSITIALLANGTGGPADWAEAMRLLAQAAASDPLAKRELELISAMALTETGRPLRDARRERVSLSPEVYVYPGLLSEAECDFLIDAALPLLQPAVVIDPVSRQHRPNPVRTSDSASFPLAIESPAIHALCRRLAAASGTDVKQGEPLQVLRYRPGEEYRPHFDAINNADNQRVLTFLVYLNDGFEGGETRFLTSDIKVKGRKGDGLLFRNADRNGRPDPASRHAGLPVTAGEKFLASRWIRQRPLQY